MSTFKLALVIWVITGVTVAGAIVTAILATPSLAEQTRVLLPAGAAAGFAIAFIVSLVIARQINNVRDKA